MKYLLTLAAATALLFSCEPIEIDDTHFDDNGNDTTYTPGFKMSMKTNGTIINYNSQGVGVSCTDTTFGNTFWGLATGNSVVYDPLTGTVYTASPNDTMMVLLWVSQTSGVGSFTTGGMNSMMPGSCFMQTPTSFTEYDPTQLQINITKLTADSIYGNYSGALNEIIWVVDSTGNHIPMPTGQIDTVAATFSVLRTPC